MLNIINNSTNPYFNLALEEYLLKIDASQADKLILWQNAPTIVVGKNQNTLEEINYQYVKEYHIHVVRRLTGGGAVYHDPGNLNFSFIISLGNFPKTDFSVFAEPIIYCLANLGIKAEFDGRNDITVEGKKFSGNAQCFYRDKLLHHGTILFDSDLNMLGKALKPKKNYVSKAVKSVQSRVTNLKKYLPADLTVQIFQQLLARSIFAYHNRPYLEYVLTEADLSRVNQLAAAKYSTWEWNFGSSPVFNFQKALTFTGGNLTLNLNISQGLVKDCKIYGDFFEHKPVEELETLLTGQRYEETNLQSLLEKVDVSRYISGLTLQQLLTCLF